MLNFQLFFLLLAMSSTASAQIRNFQTSRLNSTAGAGVASILATEAAILNPATAGFFQVSSISYHSYNTSLRKESVERQAAQDPFPGRNFSQGIFITDHTGPVKGGLSYLRQNENHHERERIVMHGAAPIGPATSMGISYRYTQDKLPPNAPDRHDTFHQLSLGTAHIVDPKTVLGLLLVDPTRAKAGEESLSGGIQYSIAERFTLIGDVGFKYTGSISHDYHWNVAVQLIILDDLFVRVGQFHDNFRLIKGTGWGVSWIGPRMGLEFAQRISQQYGEAEYIYQGETLVDTSLSAIIKF